MKNTIILLISLLLLVSCKEESPKNYVTLSGKITNKNSNEILVRDSESHILKTIFVNNDGSFKDTLTLKKRKI